MTSLSISEVASRSAVPATTLRYYEDRGLIVPPPRRGGRRQYCEEVLDTLTVITASRDAGFTLDEVQVLLDAFDRGAPGPAWVRLAETKRRELTLQVQRLEAMLEFLDAVTTCRCGDAAECADNLRQRPADLPLL